MVLWLVAVVFYCELLAGGLGVLVCFGVAFPYFSASFVLSRVSWCLVDRAVGSLVFARWVCCCLIISVGLALHGLRFFFCFMVWCLGGCFGLGCRVMWVQFVWAREVVYAYSETWSVELVAVGTLFFGSGVCLRDWRVCMFSGGCRSMAYVLV